MEPPPLSDLHIAVAARAISCEGKVLPNTNRYQTTHQHLPAPISSLSPSQRSESNLPCCLNFFEVHTTTTLTPLCTAVLTRDLPFALPRRSSCLSQHTPQHHGLPRSSGWQECHHHRRCRVSLATLVGPWQLSTSGTGNEAQSLVNDEPIEASVSRRRFFSPVRVPMCSWRIFPRKPWSVPLPKSRRWSQMRHGWRQR